MDGLQKLPMDSRKVTGSPCVSEFSFTNTCVKPNRRFMDLVQRFSDRTSCVGPGYIGSSRTWHSRTVWIALFIGALFATGYMTYKNIEEYSSFNTKSTISVGFAPLQFPMVTICNTNPIRRTQIPFAHSESLQNFLNSLDSESTQNYQADTFGWSDLFWDENSSDVTPTPADVFDWEYLEYGGKKDPRAAIVEEFTYLYGLENSYSKVDLGHQIEDMLISCSFAGRECSEVNFTTTPSNEYGNCFSFNFNRTSKLISRRSGNLYGLSMILYLQNSEYIAGLTSGYGARLAITQPGAMSLPEMNGIYLSAGAEVDVGLQLVNITRLADPYSKCKPSANIKEFHGYRWDYRYTRQACQATCLEVNIMEKCKCFRESQLHLYPAYIDPKLYPCGEEEDTCVGDRVDERTYFNNLTCNCQIPCWEPVYDTLLSSRDWPTNDYIKSLEKLICGDTRYHTDCDYFVNIPMAEKRRNFLKVNVFFRDLNFEDIKEEPDYPASQFYSDLGGSIGLFLGLSVLSIFEIIELLLESTEWGLEKLFGKKAASSVDSDEIHRSNFKDGHDEICMDDMTETNFRPPLRYTSA